MSGPAPRELPHLPLLRHGRPYRSVGRDLLRHAATGEPVAEISRAEPALIARDLAPGPAAAARRELAEVPAAELIAIAGRAAGLFASAELPAGDAPQGFDDYLRQLSATTGLPETLCRANAEKIRTVLAGMEAVLAGLTRGLDGAALEGVLDGGWAVEDGRTVAYRAETDVLAAVLPSNSPGVHGLWLPATALKVPLALKPGGREPWTPYRVAQAMTAAGCPPAAFSFYPSGHAAAAELLLRARRSMVFGDRSTVAPWVDDPRVEVHGPGWSKVIVGRDRLDHWPEDLDLIAESVAANGGRSCLNASAVWVARPAAGGGRRGTNRRSPARGLAEALAERLAAIEALPLDHPEARLAAFPDPAVARRISEHVDRQLAGGGAEDLTARHRGGRLAEAGGCTFLLPTVVWCDRPDHPLAGAEYLFPFASVVEVDQDEIPARLGPTLVATALTADPAFARALTGCRAIDRLNLGPVPTGRVEWDQPHEGNLFEHLYRRRALGGPALELAAVGATGSAGRAAEVSR
jgi:acyl-CoA reductase-like NAD-dependent aldehyde dehydrogenase